MLQKGVVFWLRNGTFLNRNGKQTQEPLFHSSLQNPIWRHMASMLCNVWDVWRGMILGSAEFCSLNCDPGPSTLWCMEERSSCPDPQRYLQRNLTYLPPYLPTRASSCCLEKQHTKAVDKWTLLICTDILLFVPWGPPYLFFHDFLTFLFFVYFSLFRGSWRKWNEAVEFPECSPSSHWLCAVRGHVTFWSWADTGLSSDFENPGPARARGSPTFDQSHCTIGDVASQSQGLHFSVRGYL